MNGGIFKPGQSILLAGVRLSGKTTDILVDAEGTIAAIGEDLRKGDGGGADFILDGSGRIAIPGLVNTHTHAAMTLFRGYADDMHLQAWLSEKIWPLEAHLTGEDVYWGTKLACLEMVRTGTVAFNDMYFFMEDAARAIAESGLKAQLAYGFIDLFDEAKREKEIRATEECVRTIRGLGNPKIIPAVGPHAPYTVSREGLMWLSEYSREEGLGIHVHLSETEQEVKDCIERNGMRPPAFLDSCGILSPATVAAHCCWLDEGECRLLAGRGVSVSHNPASNMKLATGRAMPYHWLRREGATVTLGTDGCASNNNLDLFEEMKIASLLQKFFWNSDVLLPAAEALAMATEAGARALGLGGGKIAVGESADIVLLDARSVCNTPLHHEVSNIVYSCSGAAVRSVLCGGRVLMCEGEIPGEEEIMEGARNAAASLLARAADDRAGA